MKRVLQTLLLAAIAPVVGADARADIIASYDFDPINKVGSVLDDNDALDANWTTSGLLEVSTFPFNGAGHVDVLDIADGNNGQAFFSAARENESNVNTTYVQFSVQAASGVSFDFAGQTLEFDELVQSNQGGNSRAAYDVFYSIDGTNFSFLASQDGALVAGSTGALLTSSGNLSFGLDAIGTTDFVAFRIDPRGNLGNNDGQLTGGAIRRYAIDNLVVNAAVAVPEPGSAVWLCGLVLAGGVASRRR